MKTRQTREVWGKLIRSLLNYPVLVFGVTPRHFSFFFFNTEDQIPEEKKKIPCVYSTAKTENSGVDTVTPMEGTPK